MRPGLYQGKLRVMEVWESEGGGSERLAHRA